MNQELEKLQHENKQIKDLLVNEVAARQQINGRLEQMSQSAQAMQVQFAGAMQEIRVLNKADNKEAISAKIDSLIGPEPEAPVKAK